MPTSVPHKTTLMILVLSILLVGWVAADDLPEIRRRGVLEVAARPVSTLIYSPGNSELPGFCYELAREFARSLGVEIAVHPADSFSEFWRRGADRTKLSLLSEVDLYAEILTVTQERGQLLHMTPYVENTEVLVGRADSRATDLRDLLGKRVAVVEGMSLQYVLEEAFSRHEVPYTRVPATLKDGVIVPRNPRDPRSLREEDGGVRLLLLPSGVRTTLMFFPEQLSLGSIDFFVLDSFSLFHQLNVSQALRDMVRPLFPVNERIGKLAFGSSFETPELNGALERWISEFRTTAAYDDLFNRYIGMPYGRYRAFIEDFPE